MLIAYPAAFGIGILAIPILAFLFPSSPGGDALLAVGAISILFLSLSQISTGILHGLSVLKIPVIAALLGALIKIPLNFILIGNPYINILGAVISTTICYVVASFINLFFVYKKSNLKPEFKNTFIKPFFASAIMGIVIFFLRNLPLIVPFLVGVLIYGLALLFLKVLTENEIKMLPFSGIFLRIVKYRKRQ
jgi:stage V sporulation protein B